MSGSDLKTPNFGYTLPTVGADSNTWGNLLNANWSKIDTDLKTATTPTASYLPLTGGVLSGNLAIMVPSSQFAQLTLGISGQTNVVAGNAYGSYQVYVNNAVRMQLNASNGVNQIVGPWTDVSDIRVKDGVQSYAAGLGAVMRLRPVSFKYSADCAIGHPGKTYYGLNAQDVQQVLPEFVHELQRWREGDALLGVDSGSVVMVLINAVKELVYRLERLEHAATA